MSTSDPRDDDLDGAGHDEQPFRIYTAASFGQAIRHYRLKAGLSQAQLAEEMGIDRYYLSRLERGHETFQVRNLVAILRRLGVRATLQRADW
jgi:ribosome-binding protein aMBF1 (putative translation factor)